MENSFGFKIVDRDLEQVERVVGLANERVCPLEIGLGFGEQETISFFDQVLPQSGALVNTHLDFRTVSILFLHRGKDELKRQIETSLKWGADCAVSHVARRPVVGEQAEKQLYFRQVSHNLSVLNDICAEYNFPVYIENTFHELDFYRGLFQVVEEYELTSLDFCFDIGHAKVWSDDRLSDWLEFLGVLEGTGKRLHFHLHANTGDSDNHMSLLDAKKLGHTDPDWFTGCVDFLEALKRLGERFPKSRKIFEVPTDQAAENLSFFLDYINKDRSNKTVCG